MISFELTGGIPAGKHLMNNVKLCFLAESLGAVETMITHPATMTHAEVPEKERHGRCVMRISCKEHFMLMHLKRDIIFLLKTL